MADVKPLFTALDVCLLQQGLQKMVNECDEHRESLLKGQQSVEKDASLQSIIEYYNKRKADCHQVMRKLPLLQKLSSLTGLQA